MMCKRGTIAVLLIIFSAATTFSQELSNQVMVPAAGLFTNSALDLGQTIGESAVTCLVTDDFTLTQGFQQPRIIYSPGTKPEGTGVNVYPSPVTESLTIELFGEVARMLTVTIVNIYGSEIYSEKFNFTGPYWYKITRQVSDLSQGIYMVRVISSDKFVRRTIKFEKL